MNCPNCQTSNPEEAKFCFNCGTSLSINCLYCSTPLNPSARFCFNCGQPVAAGALAPTPPPPAAESPSNEQPAHAARHTPPSKSNPAEVPADPALDRLQQYIPRELLNKLEMARANRSMAGERRIVTVLFCDIKGSTSLAEMLDPEEWAEIMNGAFKFLIEPIYKYEGTLARLMGDAILAFFGAPIAHEDDPQRAVLAALDILQRMNEYREQIKRLHGFDLNVRVGINTGLVVVGEVGSDLRVEYTAMGDAVNLASRMEQTANPDTVRISGNTYKSVSNLFHFKALGSIDVRGKSEAVPAYEVLGVREGALPTRGIEGLSSPMVGRARELAALQAAMDDVTAGLGRLVSIMGEAGLGKSRLVAELRNSLTPGSVAWYEGRSLSYETSIPYAPFIDLFSSMVGLRSIDSDTERYMKVKAAVEEVMPTQSDALAPFMATFLGIKLEGDPRERVRYLEPPMLRSRIAHTVVQYVGALAGRGPIVLHFEDLHWVDPTSLELIEALFPLTESTPLMLLAVFRPNKQEPSWRFHEIASRDYDSCYTRVSLQPLDATESRELVANLLEIEDLPEKVRALILHKAEGNPFFVEEVIRSLLDAKLVVRDDNHWRATREIENIAVPDTLQGVITARLDRLDDESKYVAQTAAVVGREFQYDVLGEVYETPGALDPSLTNLQQRELVREKSRLPRRAYMFKHVLTQETAYASLLLSRRRSLHRRVAECLERVEPERVNEIAHHYVEAREIALALPYILESADRAARSGSREEAIRYYRQVIDMANTLDDHAHMRRAYEGLGKTLEFAMRPIEAIDAFKAMQAYAEEHDDAGMQISALNKMSYTHSMVLGQMEEAVQCLEQAEDLARKHEQVAGLIEATTVRCGICSFAADFSGAAKHLAEAARLGREIDDKETTALGLAHRANMLTHLTHFDEAYETAKEGLLVTDEVQNLEHRADLMVYPIPMYHLHNGDLAEAYKWAEEGYTIGARIGASISPIIGSYVLGHIAELQGNYGAAMEWHRKGLQHARPLADFMPFMLLMPLGGLGMICLDISDELKDRAVAYHTEAAGLLSTPMGIPGGGTAWPDLGFCALELGYPEVAYERFQNGLNLPSMLMYVQKPRLLAGAALAAQTLGKTEEATGFLDEAHKYTEEGGFKWFYPLVALVDARVSSARGNSERALEQYKLAETLAREMGMRHMMWQAQLGAAELLRACGNMVESHALQANAQQTIDELTASFKDDTYKEAFRENMARKIV